MNFTRRHLFAGSGAAAAAIILDTGILNVDAFASTLTLDTGQLDGSVVAGPPPAAFDAQDWAKGTVMWDAPYGCQPYMAAMPNGDLVSALTVGEASEGDDRQHTIVLRSVDHGETWSLAAEMEPAEAPEASWGIPWVAPSGRLYVFYTYNVDNIRVGRRDCIGIVAYRSSMDGTVWSERGEMRWPPSAIDLRNPWGGVNRYLWTTGHAFSYGDAAYFGLSKMGSDVINRFADTEAFIVKTWEAAPGVLDYTISSPIALDTGNNEEPSPIVYGDGTISVMFRTNAGQLGEAWSTDDGVTWGVDWARDGNGEIIPHPRAKAPQFLLPDGRVMLWTHSNQLVALADVARSRNPVYYRIGERDGVRTVWGPPRLLLWDRGMEAQLSYPSMLVESGQMLIATSAKKTVKTFRFPFDGF